VIEQLRQAAGRPVSRETFEKLAAYVSLLREASEKQNLVSASTLDQIWGRHILDSAQLARYEPKPGATWVDVGSGAGLPGIVVACLVRGAVTLIEPRRLRAEFLHKVVESLSLQCEIRCAKAERVSGTFDVISARAVAPLARLLKISAHLSTGNTVWALPKGRSAERELAAARKAWQGAFRLVGSASDAESLIVVATGVRAKK